MPKTDTKTKPAERFSILIVPRNRSNVRRFSLSRRAVHAAAAAAVSFAVMVSLGAYCLVHYYGSYRATEDIRVEAADFMREKASLLGRLAELEASVARTERFAAKIETAVGNQGDGLAGKGPIDEDDSLPAPDQISGSRPASLGGGSWKSPFSKSLSAGLNLAISDLAGRSDKAEAKVHTVFALKQDKAFFWASLPSTWPAHGWVTSEFGVRRGWGGNSRTHEGIDIAAPIGTPIIAPGDGLVTFTGYDHGYGQTVRVDHGYGITTVYAHCSSYYVTEGQRVKRGMLIAAIGNTGRSTGPHLHFEVRISGSRVNPLNYIR